MIVKILRPVCMAEKLTKVTELGSKWLSFRPMEASVIGGNRVEIKSRKVLIDWQLYIKTGGKRYNALGVEAK